MERVIDGDGVRVCELDGVRVCELDGESVCELDGVRVCELDGVLVCELDGVREADNDGVCVTVKKRDGDAVTVGVGDSSAPHSSTTSPAPLVTRMQPMPAWPVSPA